MCVIVGSMLLAAIALSGCARPAAQAKGSPVAAPASSASIPDLQITEIPIDAAEQFAEGATVTLKPGYKVLMTGSSVTSVEETSFAGIPGRTSFLLSFDASGTLAWSKITRDHVGRQIAFVLHGRVLEAPVVLNAIEGGQTAIDLPTDGVLAKELEAAVQRR